VAESNRRGDEDATEHVDDVFDDAVDDDATADDDSNASGRGGTAVKERAKSEQTEKVGIFGRVGRFVLEVIAELRKVIWPTRKELVTYTSVVIVFVLVTIAYVSVLDFGFAKGVLAVFG
jgi:preprotein translocase subunit SecE